MRRRFMTMFVNAEDPLLKGSTSRVSKARNVLGEIFALKRMEVPEGRAASSSPAPSLNTQGRESVFFEEYRTQLAVSRLKGFPNVYGFGTIGEQPVIIMEWVQGITLRQALREMADAPDEHARFSAQQVCALGIEALRILQRVQVMDDTLVHRDISPRNIMLRTSKASFNRQMQTCCFDVCLIDFGSAVLGQADASFTMKSGYWRGGTPSYAPPEMLTNDVEFPLDQRYSQAIDVYALCSVLFQLYSGKPPFEFKESGVSYYRAKVEGQPAALVPTCSQDAALTQAIESGLAIEQNARPTVSQLLAAFQSWQREHDPEHVQAADGPEFTPTAPSQLQNEHLEVASLANGGMRASLAPESPQAAEPRLFSRRDLLATGIVAAGVLVSAGILGSHFLGNASRSASVDASRYATTDAVYAGEPLFKALDGNATGWAFYTKDGALAFKPSTSRECGQLREGLVWVYDDISQLYGYCAPLQNASSNAESSGYAWKVLPAFAQAKDFSEGVAAARDADSLLWGYIDADGAWAIPAQFHDAMRFSNGKAAVQANDGDLAWGEIDTSGAWTMEPTLQQLGARSEDGFVVACETEGKWGLLNSENAWAFEQRFTKLLRFENGLAPAQASNGLWGFIASDGTWGIKPQFMQARPFSSGQAAVQDAKTQLWHFIGTDGKAPQGMKPTFNKLGDLHDGLAPAQATADDDHIQVDENDPDSTVYGIGLRYGYVDANQTWQMRQLADLTDTAIGTPEI